jgi:AraC-like DNA-binding protein
VRYHFFPPSAALAATVRCLWIFEAPAARGTPAPIERIVPDGCTELVVHYGDRFAEAHAGIAGRLQPRSLFAGQLAHPLWLRATGSAGVIGARFHPFAARRIAGLPLDRLTDLRLDSHDLWPNGAAALEDAIGEACDDRERVAILERFLLDRLAGTRRDDDEVIARCVGAIERESPPIDELVRRSGLGRRQLERRFGEAVGLPPRLFARVVRVRRVVDAVAEGDRWTDAAHRAGYFDQSHLVRDFQRFVGCAPTEFAREREGLAAALADG